MNKAFFIGIKGVGMTSLALSMQEAGWEVTGSDTNESFITDEVLEKNKIKVSLLEEPLPLDLDLIVYSAAYAPPETSVKTVPLAQAIADFVKDRKVIAVAGVGGKTTTSAMLAALFHAAGRDVGYYVGTSTIVGLAKSGHNGTDPYFVVESDEYAVSKTDQRAKFELLEPDILVTTNIVHDHPDIYPDEKATLAVFGRLLSKIKPGGVWICNPDDPLTALLIKTVPPSLQVRTYSFSDPLYKDLNLSVFGEQNRLDALAAFYVAVTTGLSQAQALASITAYQGAGRRQEFHGEVAGRLLYDDYGHHPDEIAITLKAFKEHFPGKRLILVFESHTYTRTEALLPEFAKAIATADIPVIMPIFESAREKGKAHSITPESFAAEVAQSNPSAFAVTWENAAVQIIKVSQPGDIILTMGAGFVYKLHEEFKRLLK